MVPDDLTIPIPPVVNNHALKISNTNKSQPKNRHGVWWSKEGCIRTSTKDGTTTVTSFLLFCLVDKSICNFKHCRKGISPRIWLFQEVAFHTLTTPSAVFDSRTSTCRRSVHVDEHFRWRSVERTGQIIRKSGPAERASSLETRMQWTGRGIRTGTLPSKRGRRE